MATAGGDDAGADPSSGSAATRAAVARAEELAEELARTVQATQAQLLQDRDLLDRELETAQCQLRAQYSQQLLQAEEDLRAVQAERAALWDFEGGRQNEIVTLNVGGELFMVKRDTLRVCRGSYLADLFSGRWEGQLQKDAKGNVFLDLDPGTFELLLSWLRDRKIESPDRPAPTPSVPGDELQHFQAMADYFGLRPYLDLPGQGT